MCVREGRGAPHFSSSECHLSADAILGRGSDSSVPEGRLVPALLLTVPRTLQFHLGLHIPTAEHSVRGYGAEF